MKTNMARVARANQSFLDLLMVAYIFSLTSSTLSTVRQRPLDPFWQHIHVYTQVCYSSFGKQSEVLTGVSNRRDVVFIPRQYRFLFILPITHCYYIYSHRFPLPRSM